MFGQLDIRARLAANASLAECSILVPQLRDEYRTALSYARTAGFEGFTAELNWLGQFLVFLQRFPTGADAHHESQYIAERILRTRVAAGHVAAAITSAGVAFLASTRQWFLATADPTVLDAADNVLRDLSREVDPLVAGSLLDLGELEFGLMRVAAESDLSASQQQLSAVLVSGHRLLGNPLLDETGSRFSVLYSLALAHGLLADSLPGGPDRRAHRLAVAEALETARRLPGSLLNAEGLDAGLGEAYLKIALDQLDNSADAVLVAAQARALLHGILANPSMLADPSKRAVTHFYFAWSLWVVALHNPAERPTLAGQAREHALAAVALGVDSDELLERLDALGTSY